MGDLIEARMYSGQELYGEEIELEYRRLERMAQELNDKISE